MHKEVDPIPIHSIFIERISMALMVTDRSHSGEK